MPELSPEALAAAKPVVDACPAGAENLPIRLAALLLSLGEDGTRRTLRRLRCSNACIEETAVLVREVVSGVPVAFSSDTSSSCGTQRMLCALSGTRILLAAAPTATPCFRRRRQSLPLQAIPSPALLPSATGSHPSGRSSEKLPSHPALPSTPADYWANITCVPCSVWPHWAQPCSRNAQRSLLSFPNWPNDWMRMAYAAASASWL